MVFNQRACDKTRDIDSDERHIASVSMSVLSEEKKQQVIALGKL
jgi:hypothetical protein